VDDVEQLHDGRAIVGNRRGALVVDDELVHTARTEGSPDSVDDSLAGIDVGNDLYRLGTNGHFYHPLNIYDQKGEIKRRGLRSFLHR
jgi:hypothetical protein